MRLAETTKKKRFEFPFHIAKKLDISKKKYWIIKIAGFLSAFLIAGIVCTILKPGSFGVFYAEMFLAVFNPNDPQRIMEFLTAAGLLMLVAFALAPAFKMRFWNIGGEGQILVGALAAGGVARFMGASGAPDALIIIICLISALAAGIVWALIPALFKAFFNTNETLFTLMMNYIAIGLIAIMINIWVPNGSQTFGTVYAGSLPDLFSLKYSLLVLIAIVVVIMMCLYLKFTKHGYEITVVGESVNTARYIGINVRKVIIRTMILSGAICGLVGFLLFNGYHHTVNSGLAGGRGFTGVLIAWLGGFKPSRMIIYAILVAFFQKGSTNAASAVGISKDNFSSIIVGIFFLIIIATEFFVNYKVMLKHPVGYYWKLTKNIFSRKKEVLETSEGEINNEEELLVMPDDQEIANEEIKDVNKKTTSKAKNSSKTKKKPLKQANMKKSKEEK